MYVSPSCHSSYGVRPRLLPRLLLDVAYRYTSNMNRARYHLRPSRRDSHNTAKQFRHYEYKFCWNIRNFQLLRDTKMQHRVSFDWWWRSGSAKSGIQAREPHVKARPHPWTPFNLARTSPLLVEYGVCSCIDVGCETCYSLRYTALVSLIS